MTWMNEFNIEINRVLCLNASRIKALNPGIFLIEVFLLEWVLVRVIDVVNLYR